MCFGGLRFRRKLNSLSGSSCLVKLTMLIGFLEGRLLLSDLFVVCCVRWQRKILQGRCCVPSFRSSVAALSALVHSIRVTIEEFLLHSPFSERGGLLWHVGVCGTI